MTSKQLLDNLEAALANGLPPLEQFALLANRVEKLEAQLEEARKPRWVVTHLDNGPWWFVNGSRALGVVRKDPPFWSCLVLDETTNDYRWIERAFTLDDAKACVEKARGNANSSD